MNACRALVVEPPISNYTDNFYRRKVPKRSCTVTSRPLTLRTPRDCRLFLLRMLRCSLLRSRHGLGGVPFAFSWLAFMNEKVYSAKAKFGLRGI